MAFEKVLLQNACNINYGKNLLTKNLTKSGFPVYGSNGIIGYFNSYTYDDFKVLISCRGISSGKVSFSIPYSFVTSNSLILEPKQNFSFVYLFFECLLHDFISKVTGSAQPQLTIDNIKNDWIEIPDRPINEKIVSNLSPFISKININNREIALLEKIKNILLNII